MQELNLSSEMGDTGMYLRSPWRAIRCRARARSWMALDRIGDVEQILKISIAWMGELPQRAPDQHSRRTGKPPPLLPTFVPGRLSDQQVSGAGSPIGIGGKLPPRAHGVAESAGLNIALQC